LAAEAPAEAREKASTPTQQNSSAQLGSGATEAVRQASLAATAAAAQVPAFLDVDVWLMIGGAHAAVRNAQVAAFLQECRDQVQKCRDRNAGTCAFLDVDVILMIGGAHPVVMSGLGAGAMAACSIMGPWRLAARKNACKHRLRGV
jgi:hypothetical protein